MEEPTVQVVPDDKSKLVDLLYQNPATRTKLLELVKEHAPNVRIPEIDTPREVLSALKGPIEEIKKERDELRRERQQEREERTRTKILSRRDLALSEEDVPEIEKLMTDRKLPDFETAAEFYAGRRAAAAPRSIVPTPFEMPKQDGDYVKKLLKAGKGDRRVALDKAFEVAAELAEARR